MVAAQRQNRSLGVASLAGTLVGLGALVLYVVSGLLVANWSLGDFLARLDAELVAVLLLVAAVAVACFAIPVAAYLHSRLVAPLAVLSTVVVGWTVYGLATGVLSVQTVFGLAVYAMYFVPVYVLLYAVTGGVEYRLRG